MIPDIDDIEMKVLAIIKLLVICIPFFIEIIKGGGVAGFLLVIITSASITRKVIQSEI